MHAGKMLFAYDHAAQLAMKPPKHSAEKVFNIVRWRFHKQIDNRFPDPRTFDELRDEIILNGSHGYTRKATRIDIQHPAR